MKLVSYNIQYSKGRDGRYDLERIADSLQGADVIALQEVERNWPHSGMTDQPALLEALMPGYYAIYGPGFDMDASEISNDGVVTNRRRQFGNMILARWPLIWSRVYSLPRLKTVDQYEIRACPPSKPLSTRPGPRCGSCRSISAASHAASA